MTGPHSLPEGTPSGGASGIASPRRPARAARRRRSSSLGEVANWRTAAYRVFASVLLAPEPRRFIWLGATAGELRAHDDALAELGFFCSWQRLLAALEGLDVRDTIRLSEEHVRLFSVSPSGTPCSPYESSYVETGGEGAGWVKAHLQHTYRRAGLAISGSLNESPDHVAVELEFMSYLCRQEAADWERRTPDQAVQLLAQERMFLRTHLGRWFGDFGRLVQATTVEPLYALAAEAAGAFVEHDRDLVDALSNDVRRLLAGRPA